MRLLAISWIIAQAAWACGPGQIPLGLTCVNTSKVVVKDASGNITISGASPTRLWLKAGAAPTDTVFSGTARDAVLYLDGADLHLKTLDSNGQVCDLATATCVDGTVATPTFDPAAGTYSSTQSVTIATTTSGATICYTTDGSTPAADTPGTCSAGSTYSAPVSVVSTATVKALGTKAAMTNSAVGSAAYTIEAASVNIGLDFRATSGYVTDPANTTYVLKTDTYPTTRGGVTFGWEDAPTDSRDRTNAGDARLAGVNYVTNGGSTSRFRVDLPSAGTYTFTLAAGDPAYNGQGDQKIAVQDGTTPLTTISGAVTAGSQYLMDAAGNITDVAGWLSGEQTITLTFTGTVARFVVGDSAGSGISALVHLRLTK